MSKGEKWTMGILLVLAIGFFLAFLGLTGEVTIKNRTIQDQQGQIADLQKDVMQWQNVALFVGLKARSPAFVDTIKPGRVKELVDATIFDVQLAGKSILSHPAQLDQGHLEGQLRNTFPLLSEPLRRSVPWNW